MFSSSFNTNTFTYTDTKVPITLAPKAMEPKYQTEGAVGADLHCLGECHLQPSIPTLVDTGVSIQLGAGTAGLVYLRSSIGLQGVILANGVGVIDPDYRGTIKMCLLNMTDKEISYAAGHRIGQLLITPVSCAGFRVVTELDHTNRGNGGFGSTGTT